MKTLWMIGISALIGLIVAGVLLMGCGATGIATHMFNDGMMNGSMMYGQVGMMGHSYGQSLPRAAPDDNRPVDRTITIVAQNLRFEPSRIEVQAGQTVRFVITNRDGFAHNFVSPQAGIGERVIASGATESVVWTAPPRKGTYRAQCTYHPAMLLEIDVS